MVWMVSGLCHRGTWEESGVHEMDPGFWTLGIY